MIYINDITAHTHTYSAIFFPLFVILYQTHTRYKKSESRNALLQFFFLIKWNRFQVHNNNNNEKKSNSISYLHQTKIKILLKSCWFLCSYACVCVYMCMRVETPLTQLCCSNMIIISSSQMRKKSTMPKQWTETINRNETNNKAQCESKRRTKEKQSADW